MKKMNFFAAVATIVVLCTMVLSSCETADDVAQAPKKEDPKKNDPSTPETTDWRWSVVGDQTLDFFTDTEIVEAKNIGQLTRLYNGTPETKLDSVILRYQLAVNLKAPKRVVVESKDTTVLGNARTSTSLQYGEYVVSANKDSVCSVSTGHTFPTSYYNIEATTTSKRGYSIHAGHWEPFKYITESAQWSKIWHEPITEVTMNDSVFNREVVHNELVFKITSNKGNSWYIYREEVVIVDHFVKKAEGEKEDKINWDYDVEGLGRMVSLTINIRPDTNTPYVCAHFEGAKGHTFIVDNYDKDGKYTGHTEKHFLSYDIAEKSNDYNGVGFIKGNFYPGYIEYTIDKKDKKCGWVITCRAIGIEDNAPQQAVDGGYANTCGLKNFHEGNSAYTTPFIKNNTSTSKEVNGKMVWYVSGKTSEKRELVPHTVIDSSLK